ncbi:DUF6972 family protein [Nostoc sp. MG11]|uniref:DUF6972 family protein n=1 Tax=Nostoc sp. MG11 TaxID=2721166 RepID=UPI0039B6FE48
MELVVKLPLTLDKLPSTQAGTPQSQRLLKRGLAAHVFNDEPTMNRVIQAIIENGAVHRNDSRI